MRSSGTVILFNEDDGPVGEDGAVDNYVIVCDGTAYVADAAVRLEADGTYTHRLTIKGCKPAETTKETQ
jgi:hypothetical protein